jgi:hypothetical protein
MMIGTADRAPDVSFGAGVVPRSVRKPSSSKGAPLMYRLAVDVIDVAVGALADPLTRDGDQVLPPAKEQRFLRTGFDTTRQLAFEQARMTQGALHHPRLERLVVLVSRHVERAGDQAVATPDAHRGVVHDGAFGCLAIGVDEAGRHTGRFHTVIALELSEDRRPVVGLDIVTVDHGVGLVVGSPSLLEDGFVAERGFRHRKIVGIGLDAGLLAEAASDAECDVMENAAAVGMAGELAVGPRGPGRSHGHPRSGHGLEKPSA